MKRMLENWTFTIVATAALVATVTASRCPPDSNNPIPKACPEYDSLDKTVHLAHEWDCTKFYKCDNGQPILSDCPLMNKVDRLHFNPSLQVCDWPECARCGLRQSMKNVAAHPKFCAKYYETVNGKNILRKCSHGWHFSPTEKICMPPSSAGCQ